MTISRSRCHGRVVAFGLMVLLALSLPACVSVQKSGNQDSTPPPPSEVTSVMFRSRPEHAEVYVNDEFRGSAPLSLLLPPGTHKVELRLDGFEPWVRELVVVAGNDTRVTAVLLSR